MKTWKNRLALFFLLVSFVCFGRLAASQEQTSDDSVKSWLASQAIRLRTVEAGEKAENMANTYTAFYYHVVFSTKNRVAYIKPEIESRVRAYIGGVARAHQLTERYVWG